MTTRPPMTPSAAVPEIRVPGVFLTAEWRQLLMVNYVVDPGVLTPLVPAGTELDLWEGRAYVSVVGFRFLKTRVWGMPIPFHRNFDEVNLRFYVRCRVGDEWRKGVTFVKEIVPRRAVAFVARTLYNENYVHFPMRSTIAIPGRVQYEWHHAGAWERLSADAIGESFAPAPDSEEEFITEHYWGYARQRDGTTVEYAVEHVPWRVWRCEAAALAGQVGRLYGEQFLQFLNDRPQSAFVADGSAVIFRKGVRLP
ncbi:MAG TPA: DUF2071 domain-containing protein [Gemmataceae bacterium]|nr:DUF2071 domain-containing protein [Gemmataceae bacterium]